MFESQICFGYFVLNNRKVTEMEPQISSFGKLLDDVMNLPVEQRRELVEIVGQREIEAWREETAQYARQASADFHAGKLKARPVEDIIRDLEESLNDSDD